MTTSPSGPSFKYSAFISYSHEDERWAKWLQAALETYRVPARLVGKQTSAGVIPRRLAPVCRDRSDLPGATDLGAHINEALRASANLIVICSPNASSSRWVNEEIRMFMRLGRSDRIFCLIVAGEPNASDLSGRDVEECFAPALRFVHSTEGQPTAQRFEPIAADVRAGGDGKTNAKLKLLSGLLDVGFDELRQREHRRHTQRMVAVAVVALIVMLITTGLAIEAQIERNAAVIERQSAERRQKQAENLVDFMLGDLNDKLRQVQRLDILEAVDNRAMDYFRSLPSRDVTDQALALRVNALQKIGEVRADQGNLPDALESHRAASVLAAELLRRAPEDPEREAAYAQTLNFIGKTYWFQGDHEHALENFQRAIVLLERATMGRSPDTRFAALASARTNAGRVLEARGDFAGAKVLYEAVLVTFETLVSHEPDAVRWQPELADAYDSLGKLALEQGQLTQAIAAYGNVQQIRARLSTRTPGDRSAQEDLLLSDAILGRALALCGAQKASLRYVSEAVSTARALVGYDATYTDWREELGEYSRLLGSLERSQNRFDVSATHDREALRVLTELVAADKTNASWRRELASTQVEVARLNLAQGYLDEAQVLLDTALTAISGERVSSPEDRNLRLLEAQTHIVSGQVAVRQHDGAAAHEHWTRARDAVATAAQVGADPNFLAAWASAMLLLDDAAGARPVLDRLAAMGYQTRDLEVLLVAKKQPYPRKSGVQPCESDESRLTAGFQLP